MAAIRRLPSGRYRVRWRDANGDERGETLPTKKLALVRKAEVEIAASSGVVRDPKRGRRSFGKVLTDSLEHAENDLRPSTLALYRSVAENYVLPGLGGMQVGAIEPTDLRAFYRRLLQQGVGKPTVEVAHRLVSRTFAVAVDDGLIQSNPAARAKAPRGERAPVRVLSREEVVRIVYVLDRIYWLRLQGRRLPGGETAVLTDEVKHMGKELDVISRVCASDDERLAYVLMSRDERGVFLDAHGEQQTWPTGDGVTDEGLNQYAAMALLAAFTGLRYSEVAALRRRHVRLNDDPARVEVVEALIEVGGHVSVGPTKTKGSRRSVPIASDRVAEAMRRYVEGRGLDDLLFTGRDGAPLGRTRYRARFWVPAVSFAGIQPAPGFHDLRHSYAAWMVDAGVHPKRLQERLGHTSIRTTLDVYGHLMSTLESEGSDLDEVLQRSGRGTYVAREGVTLHAVES